jgi:hypothetical protein
MDLQELTAEVERILNRHIARLMCNLEDANCPEVYKQAVKAELSWVRSDLKAAIECAMKD